MAENEPTQGKSKSAPAVEKQSAPDDTLTFPVSQLAADGATLLGYPFYVVAGALSHLDADEVLTIADATATVETWLAQPVAVDPGQEG